MRIKTIEEEINRLATLLNNTQTGCLIFCLYNTVANREDIINRLKGKLKIPIHEFYISPKQKNPLELLQHLDSANHLVICLYDIEKAFPESLGYINYQRENFFKQNWGLVFWITEYGRNEIANKAPDFWSRRSGVFDLRIKDYKQILEAQESLIAEPMLYQSKDELGKKLNLYKWLLEEYKTDKEPDKKKIADITFKIGQIYYLFGDYTQSYQWLKETLSVYEEIGYLQGLATTYNNIGVIHDTQGNYQEALNWYEKSIKISEEMGDIAGLARTYNNIGSIHKAQRISRAPVSSKV
ncbi:MAG: tetratricopeptide repeat protein, partial [bacterium]